MVLRNNTKTLLLGEPTQLIENISKNKDIELIQYQKFYFSNSNIIYQFIKGLEIESLSIIADFSVNLHENLFGLFIILNFLKDNKISIKKLIFPYFPYSRSNNKSEKCAAGLHTIIHYLNQSSIEEIVVFDPHFTSQELPFKAIIKTISQEQIFYKILKNKKIDNALIVGPDQGSSERVKNLGKTFNVKAVHFNKKRDNHNEIVHITIPDIIKSEIEKFDYFLIFDDEICSGDTLKKTIDAIFQINKKALIDVFITHNFIKKDRGQIFNNINKLYTTLNPQAFYKIGC